jgi:hypothetical protein
MFVTDFRVTGPLEIPSAIRRAAAVNPALPDICAGFRFFRRAAARQGRLGRESKYLCRCANRWHYLCKTISSRMVERSITPVSIVSN